MGLHRALEPDWQSVPLPQRNFLQRLAAQTRGIVTIGNAITLAGFLLVIAGFIGILQSHIVVGVLLIAIGRIADLADGYLADRTGTKSPIGEAFDAGIDKLELAIAIPVLLASPYANRLFIVFLLLHLVINVTLFFIANRRHTRIHPTRAGKLSTAMAWVAAGLFVLSKADMVHSLQLAISLTAVVCTLIFIVLAIVSGRQYAKQL